MKKLTTEKFILKANEIHNYKYDYSKTKYILSTFKIKIICKEHGEFEQEANSHLRGMGCSECSGIKKYDSLKFALKANQIHNYKYDYSLVNYINSHTKVKIICKEHGEFEQKPYAHFYYGCKLCGTEIVSKKNSQGIFKFIERANKFHNYKYDYSLVNYINNKKLIKIICKKHGEFEQIPSSHLKGSGCKKCASDERNIKNSKNIEKFILEANKIHNYKYDYSLVNYKNTTTKIEIICKQHKIFKQKPMKHLQGQGCPICSESKLERDIRIFLEQNEIQYIKQYGGKTDDFYLKGQYLDFYLPKYKIGIECQGEQHFFPVDFGNKGTEYSQKMFEKIKERDIKKYNLCKEYGINILYYSKYILNEKYIDIIYYKLDDLIKKINKNELL